MRPRDFTRPAIYKLFYRSQQALPWTFICPLTLSCFYSTGRSTDPAHGSSVNLQTEPPGSSSLVKDLDHEVHFYRGHTFAPSTNRTYIAQRQAFLKFCTEINICPVPLSQENLGRYIAFLSRRLCFTSVRQYLNVVRIIHLEAGHANPLEHNWYVASILKGVKRVKGCHSEQKLPITLDILKRLVCHLNLTLPLDRVFWAACLVAFYSFFRKSNLLIPTLDAFDPSRHLCRSDVNFRPDGAVLTVRWSKVIQFRERTLLIPLPLIKNSLFCPSTALLGLCLNTPLQKDPAPLFSYADNGSAIPLTQDRFISKLRGALTYLGYPANKYSGHSFRRGGASLALQCGLPVDLIKIQGDWNSNAYERYLEPSFGLRQKVASSLGSHTVSYLTRCNPWPGRKCDMLVTDLHMSLVYILTCIICF